MLPTKGSNLQPLDHEHGAVTLTYACFPEKSLLWQNVETSNKRSILLTKGNTVSKLRVIQKMLPFGDNQCQYEMRFFFPFFLANFHKICIFKNQKLFWLNRDCTYTWYEDFQTILIVPMIYASIKILA